MQRDYYLRFDNKATALVEFKVRGLVPQDSDEFYVDGRTDEPAANWAIDVVYGTGVVYKNTGTEELPIMAIVSGFHVNLRWEGPPDLAPAFEQVEVEPLTPVCKFA